MHPVTKRTPGAISDNASNADEMIWIPGGTFRMGSDKHYPEEAPAHRVAVDGFWMDRHPVTNRQFSEFVKATGHVTVAERAPAAADYPDADPGLLVPGSLVFQRQNLRDLFTTKTFAVQPGERVRLVFEKCRNGLILRDLHIADDASPTSDLCGEFSMRTWRSSGKAHSQGVVCELLANQLGQPAETRSDNSAGTSPEQQTMQRARRKAAEEFRDPSRS
jgi:hypothetical protein